MQEVLALEVMPMLLLLVVSVCGASAVVVESGRNATQVWCKYEPPTINGQLAFGLFQSLDEMCPATAPTGVTRDTLVLGDGTPEIALMLGKNGTAVTTSDDALLFRGVGGTVADVTTSMEAQEGWSVVFPLRLNHLSNGTLMALFNDEISHSSGLDDCSPLLRGGSTCPGLYAAVVVTNLTLQLHVIAPAILSRSGGALSFHVPSLFDGAWHLLGIVFEPLAAAHYVRVSLHVDGVDPFEAGLEYCGPAGAPPKRLASTSTKSTLWNTSAGTLRVGGAQASYHALLLYRDALSRQAIAAFGTSLTKAAAAGGTRSVLYAVGCVFIAAAIVFGVWTLIHAFLEEHEFTDAITAFSSMFDDKANSSKGDQAQQQITANENDAGETIANNAAAAGLPQATQMTTSTAAAVSTIRGASVPAVASSAAVIASITSISLEVPQQMSILFSHMTFPPIFREVFSNLFAMLTLRFDFPEVAIPPYAPLLVVLVGLVFAGATAVWQGLNDRQKFDASVQDWRDREASYGILLRYIVKDVFAECKAAGSVVEDEKRSIDDVVAALLSAFPTPAGRFFVSDFDDVLKPSVPDVSQRTAVAKSLQWRCEHLLEVIPVDTVTTLCMCLIPQATSRIVSLAEITTMSKKLQTMAKSFDRTLNFKSSGGLGSDASHHDDDFIRCVVEAWRNASENDTFDDVVGRLLVGSDEDGESNEQSRASSDDDEPLPQDRSLPATFHFDEISIPAESAVKTATMAWGSAPLEERALLAHINTFVRAVLTWVVEPDDDHVKAFANPFLEFHRWREGQELVEGLDVNVERGLLSSSREAAALYSALRTDEKTVVYDKAPPYNRQAPARSYQWLEAHDGTASMSAYQVRLKMNAQRGDKGPSNGCRALPINASRSCPLHSAVTVVRATEAHLMAETLDGRPIYRCCNAGMDDVKAAVHGDQHCKGDECDDGEMFMCPEATCSFAICGRCLRREVTVLGMARVHFSTFVHTLRHLNPPVTSTLSVMMLEALLFPVTQIPLLVLTCSPSVSCWLSNCYSAWSVEFVVSFALSVALLVLRAAVGVWLCMELRWRQLKCEGVVCLSTSASNVLLTRNERWEYFVNRCDRSLLRSMYVSTELSYIAWGPAVKLAFDVTLVLAVLLTPVDSVAQKVAVGLVYTSRGVMLCLTNPNLLLPLDVLAKAVVVHQLLVLGLSTAALGELVGDGGNGRGATVIVTIMLFVTFSFLCLVAIVMAAVLLSPLLTAIWNESMAALVRRDTQASLMPHNAASLVRKLEMQMETLRRKRLLCASLMDRIKVLFTTQPCVGPLRMLPYPSRGGSQIAVTAAMILQTALLDINPLNQDVSTSDTSTNSDIIAMAISTSQSLLYEWLQSITARGAFGDPDASYFSLSTRQLKDYESNALGEYLRHLMSPTDASFDAKSTAALLKKFQSTLKAKSHTTQRHRDALHSSSSSAVGPMTHCNQLQLLSAARLTDNLDFSGCCLKGCRLVRGARIRFSDMNGCDLSAAVMPLCSFVSCDLSHAKYVSGSFGSTTPVLKYHQRDVRCVAFSPDGANIASCGDDSPVRVWDTTSGSELRVLGEHSDCVTCIVFSPDGACLASGGSDSIVRVWEASNGVELLALRGHSSAVTSICFSPDGTRIVSGSSDSSFRIWEASCGGELMVANVPCEVVTCVTYFPDGRIIVSGGNDNRVRLWDAISGSEMHVLNGHSNGVESVAVSPDGTRIVSSSRDRTARVWDASSGTELLVLSGHSGAVTSVSFSPDGTHIASGSDDSTLRLWDSTSGAELRVLSGHCDIISSVAFSADGARIASGSRDNSVCIWDVTSGAELRMLNNGHSNIVTCVQFLPDGTRIVSGGCDRATRLWDAASGAELRAFDGHSERIASVAISHDGRRLASGGGDSTVHVWDIDSGDELLVLRGHYLTVTSVEFSADGTRLLSGSSDSSVRLWAACSGEELQVLAGHEDSVTSVAFSPDGVWIVSGSNDNTMRMWDTSSGAEARVIAHPSAVSSVAYCRNGRRIASGSTDRTVRLWDASSGTLQLVLSENTGAVTCVAFSPDSSRIVSGSCDQTIRVWDVASGAELCVLNGHSQTVSSVAFSPDGSRIVSGSSDRTVCVWEAELRRLVDNQSSTNFAGDPNEILEKIQSERKSLRLKGRTFHAVPSLMLCITGGSDLPVQSCLV